MWLINDNNKIYYIYIVHLIYILVFPSFYFKVKVLFDKIYLQFPFMYLLILIKDQNIFIYFRNK